MCTIIDSFIYLSVHPSVTLMYRGKKMHLLE